MGALEDFRQENPSYDDMPDAALADALHRKFYSDMPRADFDQKIGLAEKQATAPPSNLQPGFLSDDPRDWASQQPGAKSQEYRGALLPFALDKEGKASLAVPGILHDPPEAANKILRRGPVHPSEITGEMGAEGLAAAGAALPGPQRGYATRQVRPTNKENIVREAGELPTPVDLPRAAVGGTVAQATAGGLSSTPLGTPIITASRRATDQLGENVKGVARDLGDAGPVASGEGIRDTLRGRVQAAQEAQNKAGEGIYSGMGTGSPTVAGEGIRNVLSAAAQRENEAIGNRISDAIPATDRLSAGTAARDAITDWVGTGSKEAAAKIYEPVESNIAAGERLFGSHAKQELTNTRAAAGELVAAARESKLEPPKIIATILAAVRSREGLSYKGLQNLRTEIGDRMSGAVAPEPGMSPRALKAVYGGLSRDLEELVATVKPANMTEEQALSVWRQANETFEQSIAEKRRILSGIVGAKGEAAGEATLDKLHTMAAAGRGGDLVALGHAQSVMPPHVWDQVSNAIAARLGRQSGQFEHDAYRREFGGLSAPARDSLYGPRGGARRDAMEGALEPGAASANDLAGTLGISGGGSPEAVLDRLHAMGTTSRGADVARLEQTKNAVGPARWSEIASALLRRMGETPDGFSAERLATQYGRLSESGKELLFGASRKNIEEVIGPRVAEARALKELSDKLTGGGVPASPEAVLDKLAAMANAKGGADITRLLQAKALVGKATWDAAAGAIINRMGGETKDGFSIAKWRTAYSKLSEDGKTALFGSDHKATLDKIFRVGGSAEQLAKWGNPSGSARGALTTGAVMGLFLHPFAVLGAAAADYGLSRVLASPATSKKAAGWMERYADYAMGPSPARAQLLQQSARVLAAEIAPQSNADPSEVAQRLMPQSAPARPVKTFEEALKLPKKTRFIDPHGVERVR